MNHILPITNGHHVHHHQLYNQSEDDFMRSSIAQTCSSSLSHSADEVDRSTLPDLLPLNNQSSVISASTSSINNKSRHSVHMNSITASFQQQQQHLDEIAASQDMRDFEESLNKQCLCGVSVNVC
ncbi:hypothetical protein EVAR_72952_1 [Eumeta japonica]|uniref:Uncharacterized protein n=1 Tax=Eumeta variegata TaxID=151549 RepID=A0A4C1TJF2_EUMVA|nr:hypothetical protein EVAR_72952_1 [Eumeta japonica]